MLSPPDENQEQAQGQEVRTAAGAEVVVDVVLIKGSQNGQKGVRRDRGQEALGFLLAGAGLGLGSCWSNQPHWQTDVPTLGALFARYGMRMDEDIFGSVAIG